jgi:hypothetical protein
MAKGVKIFINDEQIKEHADSLGKEIWGREYSSLSITTYNQNSNNQFFRLRFSVKDKHAHLDFYKKRNSGLTLVCSGENQELAQKLSDAFASKFCSAEIKAQTCCFENISEESFNSLYNYLWEEETIKEKAKEEKEHQTDKYSCIKISSYHGDCLTINFYKTGKLVLQGKPAYLMAMVLCHISSLSEVSENNILETYEELLNFSQFVKKEPHEDLKNALPNAYSKLDDTTLKILSPALVLSKINLTLTDYSCFTFPALRALECLLIIILDKKGISHIYKNSFGSIFSFDHATKKHTLASRYKKHFKINEQLFFESVYDYLKKHRHTLFHCGNPSASSRIISEHDEANDIIQDVLGFFEKAVSEGVI